LLLIKVRWLSEVEATACDRYNLTSLK